MRRWKALPAGAVAILVSTIACCVAHADGDGASPPAENRADERLLAGLRDEARARMLSDGAPIYERFCATCHGARGDGHGETARFLRGYPLDFTRGEFRFRTTPFGSPPTEADVFRTVSEGVWGTEMPGWENVLPEADRRRVSRYVMALAGGGRLAEPAAPMEIPVEPEANAESIGRGKALYAAICSACHGAAGEGDGPAGGALTDSQGRPIRAADLTRQTYKGGRGAAVVYRAISTGLTGTPMAPFGAGLPPEQRWDVAHYVVSLSKGRGVLARLLADPAMDQ